MIHRFTQLKPNSIDPNNYLLYYELAKTDCVCLPYILLFDQNIDVYCGLYNRLDINTHKKRYKGEIETENVNEI